MKGGIPILYYHSIADHDSPHEWSFLSIDKAIFEKQIKYLRENNYYGCTWQELDQHLQGIKKLPPKTIMFHFDDGFLDNWTVVYPLMKAYSFKFSVLLTPEFVEESPVVRPFVDNTTNDNKEAWWGYLNTSEIKTMADSGLVDFQAHGYSHTWYPCSPKVIDIYNGTKFYPHIIWNNNVGRKPHWLSYPSIDESLYGHPIFEFKKSLALDKAYIPNKDLVNKLMSEYDPKMNKSDQIIEINKKLNSTDAGRYETDQESRARLKKELLTTREEIESWTGKKCNYLVFPGGGQTEHVKALCKEYDYKLISKGNVLNSFNSKVYQIDRLSAVYNFKNPTLNKLLQIPFLKLQLQRGHGNAKLEKLARLVKG